MKSFFANESEARLLVRQDKTVFLRLLGRQPPEGYEYTLRYPSGEYGVKETWLDLKVCNRYTYKADKYAVIEGNPVECKDLIQYVRIVYPYYNWKWRSPVTMPDEAIRWTIKVETTVKRVGELTLAEMRSIINRGFNTFGYDNAQGVFSDYFNKLHAKPVLTKDKTGYFCYPYDWNSFHGIYGDKYLRVKHIGDRDFTEPIYKGKLLTIHANPWVEVISVVEKIPRKRAE